MSSINNDDELFDVVDENNEVIGTEKRAIVHSKGLLHRSVNVLLFNKAKQANTQLHMPPAWSLPAPPPPTTITTTTAHLSYPPLPSHRC